MKSNSFSFWLSQLCPVLRKLRSFWLFFHIHKLLHTPTQENYHQALIWLNFNGRLPLSATELIPLFFIATTCITYKSVFFFSNKKAISYLTQPTVAVSWKDCGFCNYLFTFIIYLQMPERSKPHSSTFGKHSSFFVLAVDFFNRKH